MKGYNLRNVGRGERAEQLATALLSSPAELSERVTHVVTCPKGAVWCRVFRIPDEGLLFVPSGKAPGQKRWQRVLPYWLDDCVPTDEIRGRCRCCSDVDRGLTAGWLLARLATGEKRTLLDVR